MKVTKLCVAAASVALLTSCGGKSNEEKLRDALAELSEESVEETVCEDVTVEVESDDVAFSGDMAGCVELVPGEYTLDASGSSLKLNIMTIVKQESIDEVSSSSTVEILDANHETLGTMLLYGGQTVLNEAIENGDINSEFQLTFTYYTSDKADLLSKAKYIKGGELIATSAPKPNVDVDGSGLSKTLSEYGVTYQCKHDPKDNDRFLEDFDLKKTMKDKDLIIKAWEIYSEEILRYQFAPGESGMDNPEAYKRSENFRAVLHPESGYSDKDPIGYMNNREYSYKNSDDFTSAQKQRIESFLESYNKAFNAWRSAGGK